MKKVIQYSIIGSIAFVMFVGGFFSYSMIGQQNETSLTQSLALGGYGVVKAYHADGTLFYEWEGHNALHPFAINAISSCLVGLDTVPSGHSNCTSMITRMQLRSTSNGGVSGASTEFVTHTLLPPSCDSNSNSNLCNGWETRATFDFASLSCTAGSDCPTLGFVRTLNTPGAEFNSLDVADQEITPGDIVVVTIGFNPS